MPAHSDAVGVWGLAAMLAALILGIVAWGKFPSRLGMVRRREEPRRFWLGVAVLGAGLFVVSLLALYASISLPSESSTAVR
jgi:MFS family permease